MAPTKRVIAASLGKMPTTSVRRLISPLRRSSGLVEWIPARSADRARFAAGSAGLLAANGPVLLGEGHVGEHVLLGLVEQRCELGQLGAHLVGDPGSWPGAGSDATAPGRRRRGPLRRLLAASLSGIGAMACWPSLGEGGGDERRDEPSQQAEAPPAKQPAPAGDGGRIARLTCASRSSRRSWTMPSRKPASISRSAASGAIPGRPTPGA
jgi:hypothetical protein